MMESSDKMCSTGKGNGKSLQLLNSMKGQKDMTLKDDVSRSVGVQYATGKEERNSCRRNEGAETKQKYAQL